MTTTLPLFLFLFSFSLLGIAKADSIELIVPGELPIIANSSKSIAFAGKRIKPHFEEAQDQARELCENMNRKLSTFKTVDLAPKQGAKFVRARKFVQGSYLEFDFSFRRPWVYLDRAELSLSQKIQNGTMGVTSLCAGICHACAASIVHHTWNPQPISSLRQIPLDLVHGGFLELNLILSLESFHRAIRVLYTLMPPSEISEREALDRRETSLVKVVNAALPVVPHKVYSSILCD